MTIDDKIQDEKLQYNITKAAKNSTLSSCKVNKYEHFTGKEILLFNQRQIIKKAITYSFLGKAFKKQTKIIED